MKIYKIVYTYDYFDYDPYYQDISCITDETELGYFSTEEAAKKWIENNGHNYQDGILSIAEIDVEEGD